MTIVFLMLMFNPNSFSGIIKPVCHYINRWRTWIAEAPDRRDKQLERQTGL